MKIKESKVCPECSKSFIPEWTSSKSCSPECAREHGLRGRRRNHAAKMAIKRAAAAVAEVEEVDEEALFEHNILRESLGLNPVDTLPK